MASGEQGQSAGLKPGTLLAGCRIERRIGQGGMGTVYLARQVGLDRAVAIKVVNPGLAGDAGFAARFRSETRIAAQVEHPNVVPLYEAGEEDGVLYMLMRFVPGRDLGALLAQSGALAPRRAAGLIAQTAAGLDAVHASGLVHRDLKPANVLVTEEPGAEHAYLTDFGLAKRAASFSGPTRIGHFVGTLDYIAPEQLIGMPIDARADVYALGCLLYELLTGRVPFPRDDSAATMWAHVNTAPPAPSDHGDAGLEDFDELIARALSKRPEDRFPSAGDLGRAASSIAAGRPPDEREASVATGRAAPTTLGSAPQPTRAPGEGAVGAPAPAAPPTRAASLPAPAPGRRLGPVVSALVAAVLALGAVAGLAAAGVLGGGEGGDVPDPVVASDGPAGELSATGIGEVQIGFTEDEVEARFGVPMKAKTIEPGEATHSAGPAYTYWRYEVEDGDPLDDSVYLYFDTETSELTGYYTVSDQLGTADGIRSGDGLDRLQDAYGSSLENVSSPNSPFKVAYLLRESAEGDGPALLFGGRRGLVVQIEGGDPPPNLVS